MVAFMMNSHLLQFKKKIVLSLFHLHVVLDENRHSLLSTLPKSFFITKVLAELYES